MTVSMETKITEATSLAQTQELIMAIFSCVGYLRDLFPEESFQEHKIAGMNLKRFRKGGDRNSDQLLKWIEEGCFDALSKKYLKSAVLTILSDSTSDPNNVIETYTLRVNYPESILHQSIDATTANIAQLSLTRNDKSIVKLDAASPSNFRDSVSKILRSLCVMSQTLKNLPERRCLSMKLSYYDELTPMGYEPPGFVSAEFDIDHLFQGATNKYSFGAAMTPFHNLGLSMETVCDDTLRPNKANSTTDSQAFIFGSGENEKIPNEKDFNESVMIASQVAQASGSPPKKVKPNANVNDSFSAPNFPQSQPVKSQIFAPKPQEKQSPPVLPSSQTIQKIKCTCRNNEKDLEMLQCEMCTFWQHAVCAGYVSCRDRRLETTSSQYYCYYCRFGAQGRTFKFVKDLSIFRKLLAILSFEGFSTKKRLCDRLGMGKHALSRHFDRLVTEGFLLPGKLGKFSVAKKDEKIKEKIKIYFNQNLTIHSEFVEAQEFDLKGLEDHVGEDIEEVQQHEQQYHHHEQPPVRVPIEVSSNDNNTVPFELGDKVNCEETKTPAATLNDNNNNNFTSKPPLKKKRKISVPSSRISCYLSNT